MSQSPVVPPPNGGLCNLHGQVIFKKYLFSYFIHFFVN